MIFKCKNCGGNVVYSPERKKMFCPFCESEDSEERQDGVIETSLVVLMIMVVVAVRSVELQRKIAGYDTQIASLSAQIDAETARAEEIEEYRKYTQTKAYVEEVAKDKLGLVYEGEILFKEDN